LADPSGEHRCIRSSVPAKFEVVSSSQIDFDVEPLNASATNRAQAEDTRGFVGDLTGVKAG
jgi:hypothetical protein